MLSAPTVCDAQAMLHRAGREANDWCARPSPAAQQRVFQAPSAFQRQHQAQPLRVQRQAQQVQQVGVPATRHARRADAACASRALPAHTATRWGAAVQVYN